MDALIASLSSVLVDSSSASDCSAGACWGSSSNGASFSDQEIMLASRNPKKRAGRNKFKETRHPVYRGVRQRNSGKWVCEVREPNHQSRVWLGTYPTADMAARAHDVAALAMRGRSACLNFADSVWRLPLPQSNSIKDIQKAAAEAAEAFRPTESNAFPDQNGANVVEEISHRKLPENEFYMDEEAMFGIPSFIADMAEGLMLPPPQPVGYGHCTDDMVSHVDMLLWSFSV